MSLRKWLVFVAELGIVLAIVGRLAFLLGTEYAPGFDERQFQMILKGLSRQQVEQMLGMPFRVTRGIRIVAHDGRILDDITRYEYSRSPIDHDYEVRAIFFDATGKVVDRWDGHWHD